MPRLDLYRNRFLEMQIELGDHTLRIGRSSACDFCLNDPLVSREHAELRPTPDGLLLMNLSRFGTRVNLELVSEGCLLSYGDTIYLGGRYAITYEKDGKVDLSQTIAPHR